METLLQTLLRPEEGSPQGLRNSQAGAVQPFLAAGVPSFAAELLATAGLVTAQHQAGGQAAALQTGAQENAPEALAAIAAPFAPTGQGDRQGRTAEAAGLSAAPLLENIASRPSTNAQQGAGTGSTVAGAAASLVAQQSTAGERPASTAAHGVAVEPAAAIPATPAVPGTTEASSGVTDPAVPALAAAPAAAAPTLPANAGTAIARQRAASLPLAAAPETGPVHHQTTTEKTSPGLQHAIQGPQLGEIISQSVSGSQGSPALPDTVHAAIETSARPQIPSETPGLVQLEGGQAAATTAGAAGPGDAAPTSNALNGRASGQSSSQHSPQIAAAAASVSPPTVVSGGEVLEAQGEPVSVPSSSSSLGQATVITSDGALQLSSRPAVPQQPAVDQVTLAVQRAIGEGREQISLRLHPAELGRIDVRLELADDGIVRASILVEKPDTLTLLQRDSQTLERALQDAGVKTDSGSLAFDLKNSQREGRLPNDTLAGSEPASAPDQHEEASLEFADSRRPVHHGLLDLSV